MAVYGNQAGEIVSPVTEQFHNDVVRGLRSNPKFLMSKYFYDQAGDQLFQQIMKTPEYYLTNCELEILSEQTDEITSELTKEETEFDLVELGAGDATKSVYLLRSLVEKGIVFTYFPVDISRNVISQLHSELPDQIPGLEIKGLHGEYLEMIKKAGKLSNRKKIVFFLGANVGNFSVPDATHFLRAVADNLSAGDLLMIGFDLKKNPKQILAAYNDAAGITRQFNMNLLERINRELGGNFNTRQFDHYPTYDPISGACRSYLISLTEQEVNLADTGIIRFAKHEPVYTELSQKYAVHEISNLAKETGYKPVKSFFDRKGWFVDVIWERM